MASSLMIARHREPVMAVAPQKRVLNVYTMAACSFSQRAKELLEEYDIEYVEHDVSVGDEKHRWVIEHSGGRKVFPQLFVNDRHLGGFFELKRHCQSETLLLMLEG